MKAVAYQAGVTLVELIVFLLVVGLAAAGVMEALAQSQSSNAAPAQILDSVKIGESRLELLVGERQTEGFGALADPCASTATTPPPVCQLPAGYQIAQPTVIPDFHGNTDLTELVVKVTAPDGRILADLTDVVAAY